MSTLTEIAKEKQEKLTGYQGVISSDHAYIHQGIAKSSIISASISAAYDIAFTTPSAESGKYVHWRPIGLTTSADYVAYQLTEGDTYTGGTDATIFTRNRNINGTNVQALKYNVTSTPSGLIVQASGVGTTGNPAVRAGGGATASEELVLKPDTTYIITLTPAGATDIVLTLFWYEENGFDGRYL